MKINKFRAFTNKDIELGRKLTAIAGRNAVGKSTILGMLVHGAELKVGEGKPINFPQFRSEFGELFNASKTHDTHTRGVYEYETSRVNNQGEVIDKSEFRITWQDNGERFRFIPNRIVNGIKTAAKYKHPTLFLGLSRFYPIAEVSDKHSDFGISDINITAEEKEEFNRIYNLVMPQLSTIESIGNVESKKTSHKSVGINTSQYDAYGNSAGQNNIGKIILALMSFRKLKHEFDDYTGGLFGIDEIDATLHPAAQLKLLNVMKEYSTAYNIQIVFTTHSLILIDEICKETQHNGDGINNYEIVYLTNANGELDIIKSPSKQLIHNEITEGLSRYNIFKVNVFSEDDEARWFFSKIKDKIGGHMQLRVAEIKMGASEYKGLYKHDSNFFRDSIIVLDGDQGVERTSPMICLPGTGSNPELLFSNYLDSLNPDVWRIISEKTNYSFNKTIHTTNGWSTFQGKDNRVKQKNWFNERLDLFEQISLFDMWAEDNPQEVEAFIREFKIKYNKIARRNNISEI